MIYVKNTNTNEIEQLSQIPSEYYGSEKETFTNENGITCERLKLKDEYVILNESDLEVQEILLEEIKLNQINSIKKKRDENLSSDHFSTNAFILKETGFFQFDFVFDDDGKKVEKKFIFSLNTGGSPINHPKAIIDRVQFKSLKDANYFLRYSCRFEDGTKGYVALDANVAESISNHLEDRGTNNVYLMNKKEEMIESIFINSQKTFEQAKIEIESITLESEIS